MKVTSSEIKLIIADKIKARIGKCENLTLDDAINFFIKEYGAREIAPKYQQNYLTYRFYNEAGKDYFRKKGIPEDPAAVPESELYETDPSDLAIGVLEIRFRYPGEHGRLLLFDTESMERVEPGYDKFMEGVMKFCESGKAYDYDCFEYNMLAFSTVDDKSIISYYVEGPPTKLLDECEYFYIHSIRGDIEDEEDFRDQCLKSEAEGKNYQSYFHASELIRQYKEGKINKICP